MEVSTFELLYKPLTPTGGDIARRVFQGYFLTVTNLESQPYRYRIEFRTTTANALAAPSARFITDVGGGNVFATPAATSDPHYYYQTFTVEAGKTALVSLLPDLTIPGFFDTSLVPADVEIRGYVRLMLPCVFKFSNGFFTYGPQSPNPVRVLINPELRATYLPNDWPTTAGGDFDQTISILETATGQGLNRIPSDSCKLILTGLEFDLERLRLTPPVGEPVDRLADLLSGLVALDTDEKNIESLNQVLSKAGVGLRLTPTGEKPERGTAA